MNLTTDTQTGIDAAKDKTSAPKPTWQTPKLEDVSEQVMAQPYIRFT
jgi:hypothetical protein